MKLLTEYLEHALVFERMAAAEDNPEVRAQFTNQANAYRKLAADRATKFGYPRRVRRKYRFDPSGIVTGLGQHRTLTDPCQRCGGRGFPCWNRFWPKLEPPS